MSLLSKKSKRPSADNQTSKPSSLAIAMSVARMARKKDKMQRMAEGHDPVSPHLNVKEAKAASVAEAIRAKRIKPEEHVDPAPLVDPSSGEEEVDMFDELNAEAIEKELYDVDDQVSDPEAESDGSVASAIRKRMKKQKAV